MCFNFILIHLKLTLFALLLLTSCAEDMSPKSDESSSEVTPFNRPDNLSLVWSDEFDQGSLLDSSKWTYDLGSPLIGNTVWGNNENQHYTNSSNNVYLSDGKLVIQARHETISGASPGVFASSARVKTENDNFFNSLNNSPYGFYEIKAKIPCIKGAWPAIWILGKEGDWPDRGELDIMEWYGRYSDEVTVTQVVHTKAYHGDVRNSPYGQSGSQKIDQLCNDYNRFQLLWKETEIIFGVNDQTTFTYTKKSSFTLNEWPFDQQGFLIINIAVGGNLGGPVNTQDISSMKMYVDYVRIYQ
jgi:beta-glucanase (GH16 family)